MMRFRFGSFRVKLLVSISLCILSFCLVSSLAIAGVLGKRLFLKSERIDTEYASVVTGYMEDIYDGINQVGVLARSSAYVTRALSYRALDSSKAQGAALRAQERLDVYVNTCPYNNYMTRMVVFNTDGLMISATGVMAEPVTLERLEQSSLFLMQQGQASVCEVTEALENPDETVLGCVYPLDQNGRCFLYMEFDTDLLAKLLEPYRESASILIESTGARRAAWYASEDLRGIASLEGGAYVGDAEIAPKGYVLNVRDYAPMKLRVKTFTMQSLLSTDNRYIVYLVLFTLVTVMAAGFMVSRLVSARISRPLNALSAHLKLLSHEETLTENPQIEAGTDELADMGQVVNQLVRHINELIDQQKAMYEERQRLEMDALQAQINPHFLYNTLDSIRWMAVIQKSNGIARTVGALENLLRSMAKGVGDEISLKQELALAQDYVNLQLVRYMEIFDYVCEVPEDLMDARIVKMTLQPIIENAILHGIEPTGNYGEITVRAFVEDEDLCVVVEDNGAGMDAEALQRLQKAPKKRSKNAMSGIGVSNVDARLKLAYGAQYGLHYESEKGLFTRVTVRIPLRRGMDTDV